MAHNIVPILPRHTVYVEPFAGGAAIMFAKPYPRVTSGYYQEVINDKDGRLVNFYRQLRDNGEELCRLLELTPYSKQEIDIAKRSGYDGVEDARKYFLLVNQSFSGCQESWSRSTTGTNLASRFRNRTKSLRSFIERMADVHIEHADALTVIKNWDSPQTLFYCDPPYPGTEQSFYDGYNLMDLQDLIDALDQCVGSFVLSNYDQPDAVIPSDWERFEFSALSTASRSAADRTERTEVCWRRFNTEPIAQEITKVLTSGAFEGYAFQKNEVAQRSLF